MTKIIEINNCNECPYVVGGLEFSYCNHKEVNEIVTPLIFLKKGETIPSWCPLEDHYSNQWEKNQKELKDLLYKCEKTLQKWIDSDTSI